MSMRPGSLTLRMPGEFEPHERTVMCWPTRVGLYPGELFARAEAAHAEVARTIAGFEPVTMIAAPGPPAARATAMCGEGIDVVELPIDDSWFRDTGPTYTVDDHGGLVAVHWAFNGWGDKHRPWADDARVGARWASHAGHDVQVVPMVLEGGSITVDGEGTLLTTAECLLHPNRNPGMSSTGIEAVLDAQLGVSSVVWLPFGLALDHETDGHVDNVAAFSAPGRVLVQCCDDRSEPDHDRLATNRRIASETIDARGRELDVMEVPVLPFAEIAGRRVAAPYLNLYVGNGFVLVPTTGHDADPDMLALIAGEFPGHRTIGVDVGAILAFGGGGIHCITQQVPAVHPSV